MRRVRKFFVGICGTLCAMVCCTACRTATVAGQGQGLPDEAQRRFDYYYLEALIRYMQVKGIDYKNL